MTSIVTTDGHSFSGFNGSGLAKLMCRVAPLWGQGVDALVVADESREPEVMSRDALGSTAPAVA